MGTLPKMTKRVLLIGLILIVVGVGVVWLQLARHSGSGDSAIDADGSRKTPQTQQQVTYTSADVQKWISEAKPQVEWITGRKFKWLPHIELVDVSEMEQVLYDDMLAQFKMVYFRYPLSDLRDWVEAKSYSSTGYYLPRKRAVYLVPENLNAMTFRLQKDKRWSNELMKLVIAHEMAHCLQDQYTGMDELLSRAGTSDERIALHAAFEGHARLVTEECAVKFGSLKTFGDLTRLWCETSDKESWAGFQEKAYANGWRFMGWQEKHGGHSWLWKVLETPPDSTELIDHPEKYPSWRKHALSGTAPDYSSVLNGIEKRFGSRKWDVYTREMGGDDIRTLYADVDPSDAQDMASGTVHAQMMTATDGDTEVSVWFAIEKRPELVKRMMMLDRKADEAQLSRLRASGMTVSPIVWEPLKGIKADCAAKGTYTIEKNARKSTAIITFAGRGTTAVGIITGGLKLSDAKISEITEAVFRSISSSVTSAPHR